MDFLANQRLLTRAEIKRRYNVSSRTIDRLIEAGQITPVMLGKAVRIAENEWLKFIAGQRAVS